MHLKTKLDWQGYKLGLQNEQTMGCSSQQTAMCVAISDFREKVHQMQEVLRELAVYSRKHSKPEKRPGALLVAEELLADHVESVEGFGDVPADADRPVLGKETGK